MVHAASHRTRSARHREVSGISLLEGRATFMFQSGQYAKDNEVREEGKKVRENNTNVDHKRGGAYQNERAEGLANARLGGCWKLTRKRESKVD